jgi:hypothetical protein
MLVVVIVMVMTVVVVMMEIIMVMVVAMIMRRVAMRIAGRRMGMAAAGIGAAFGVERRLDLDHARAKTLDHRLDDMIAPDPQPLGHDLGRQMPVAEMPGDPDQMMRVGAPDLEQRLRRRDHFDQPAIVEHQRVAAAQRDGIFEVEQEFEPARAGHRHPPPVPIVEIEHDGIGRRLAPAMLAANLSGADHLKTLFF